MGTNKNSGMMQYPNRKAKCNIMLLCLPRRAAGMRKRGEGRISSYLSVSTQARRVPGGRSEEGPAWRMRCACVFPGPPYGGR